MADLVVIGYPDEATADKAYEVVVTKSTAGIRAGSRP